MSSSLRDYSSQNTFISCSIKTLIAYDMFYTIGRTTLYEGYFESMPHDTIRKMGRKTKEQMIASGRGDKAFGGGSVWLSLEAAQNVCPDGYSVYGLLCGTGDVDMSDPQDMRLLVGAQIVRL